jgi:hypothetical protein
VTLLWTVPALALLASAGVLLLAARSIGGTAAGLVDDIARLEQVRAAVATVRAEAAQLRRPRSRPGDQT